MSLDAQMSREEKEKMLSEKMENIRRRNEELRKRHEEIEADKKNADRFSSTATMDSKVKPYVMKSPRPRPEKSEKPRELHETPAIPRPSDIMPSRQRLSENDGPPPDPSYRFLSDPDRDGNEMDRKRDGRGRRKGRGGSKWGGSDGQEEEGKNDKLDESLGDEIPPDYTSSGRGFRGHGRGRNDFNNGDPRFGSGRRRGRGRGHDRYNQEDDGDIQPGDGNETPEGGRSRGRGNLSFASRDIRYYPDENDDHRSGGRDGRGRGRGRHNQGQWGHDDRFQRRGSFDSHRGRGRGGRNRHQQREYERWKAERAAIDEARLNRGKTNGGSWRREWDNDKLDQGEKDDSEPIYDPRFPRNKNESFKLADLINLPNDNGSPIQPPIEQRDKVPRNRRSVTNRESREKFVKVETGHAQDHHNFESDPSQGSDANDYHPTTRDYNDTSQTDVEVIVIPDDMEETPQVSAAEEGSTTSPIVLDSPERMESDRDMVPERIHQEEEREYCETDYPKDIGETDLNSGPGSITMMSEGGDGDFPETAESKDIQKSDLSSSEPRSVMNEEAKPVSVTQPEETLATESVKVG